MKILNVYQTLEDRDNADEIEHHGPYRCNRADAWLGEGFYFWETFLENAHWWGNSTYPGNYIICKAVCDFEESKCLDLVGNTAQIEEFRKSFELLKLQKLATDTTTVARILQFLRTKTKLSDIEACRAYGIGSKSKDSQFGQTINFVRNKPQYLDLIPAIQICFYRTNALNLRNYKIVYPEDYIDGYAV